MSSTVSPRPSAFVGWYRAKRPQRWRPVVQADNEEAALDRLLSEPPGDKIVLPVGRDPNQREVGP
jgi:hypothetical protein